MDAIALRSAQRFIEVVGSAKGDTPPAAAGGTRVCNLVIRGLAQAQNASEKSALLDCIDALMRIGADGITETVEKAQR